MRSAAPPWPALKHQAAALLGRSPARQGSSAPRAAGGPARTAARCGRRWRAAALRGASPATAGLRNPRRRPCHPAPGPAAARPEGPPAAPCESGMQGAGALAGQQERGTQGCVAGVVAWLTGGEPGQDLQELHTLLAEGVMPSPPVVPCQQRPGPAPAAARGQPLEKALVAGACTCGRAGGRAAATRHRQPGPCQAAPRAADRQIAHPSLYARPPPPPSAACRCSPGWPAQPHRRRVLCA